MQCGKEAGIYYCLPLCDEHLLSHYDSRTQPLRQTAQHHRPEAFPGYCYVVRLGDGSVKVGYSNTEETLRARLKRLQRESERDHGNQDFSTLAILSGGVVTEAVLHHQFRESRIPGRGERFTFSEEIQDFLATAPRLCIPV
ncbi:GIY-YIG nuclease family protein [Streptomyces tendae]|uniref:GIY-YIG nuclease family protein n=1 Tax=Streptomyces tendae TaxID=1932 RepID=UPI0034304EF3